MLLCRLAQREQPVGELNARLDLSPSALSQRLAPLREDGLANTRRDGTPSTIRWRQDRRDACSTPCMASSAATRAAASAFAPCAGQIAFGARRGTRDTQCRRAAA
ncbi:ArsR family transcriptional regulator [Xanthomonas sp.]|uniref:ArsR family transcriptional regulator n=1 Tax=Xanthomonas sp. TaxID=29446 RepID=UPI001F12FBE9|nr:ArsR family transcriptional regulator [Xanthomonas sp.]